MMKKLILDAVERLSREGSIKVADWRLVGTDVARQELYMVKTETELSRKVGERHYALTVYIDGDSAGKKVRGEATVTIQPSFGLAEIEEKVRQALFAASKSRNAWFDLPGPAEPKLTLPASGFDTLAEGARMETLRKALYSPEAVLGAAAEAGAMSEPGAAAPQSRINSLELFLSREEKTFINSKGQEFRSSGWRGYSEFVVEADSSQGMVELFDHIEFSDPDPSRLSEVTRARLEQVKDRTEALPMPSLKGIPVILSGKEAEDVFAWFFGNATAQPIFTKASPFVPGANVQQAEEGGEVVDPLDIWAEPFIEGLVDSSVFDADGFTLERTAVIEKGFLKTIVGSVRYADWLGVERRGSFPLFSVSPGSMSIAEMKAEPYLEPVMFSDFRLDGVTGDFGAEIRLAYWFDGKKRVPVTGGSISGSVAELRSTMRRSRECGLASRSLCPKALLLQGLSITGAGA